MVILVPASEKDSNTIFLIIHLSVLVSLLAFQELWHP